MSAFWKVHVMNLKYMKVSLFEISYKKKKKNFHHVLIFFNWPVYDLQKDDVGQNEVSFSYFFM